MTCAQVLLGLLAALAGFHVTRLLHDAVPSAVRSGVASGVGAISWMVFLPVALFFGVASARLGVHATGWVLTALGGAAGVLLVAHSLRRPPTRALPRSDAGDLVPYGVPSPWPSWPTRDGGGECASS